MSSWNDANRQRLIEAYRKRPLLWTNKCHGDHPHIEKKKQLLVDVKDYLNSFEPHPNTFTVEDIKNQFKNLKDMYRRKKRKMQASEEAGVKAEEPCWYYFRMLKFLDDANNMSKPPSPSTPSPFAEVAVKAEPESYVDDFDHPPVAKRPLLQPTPASRENLPVLLDAMPQCSRLQPPATAVAPPVRQQMPSDSDDEHMIFGQFVGRTLKKLCMSSPALAIQAKRQIHDVLCQAELSEYGV